MNEISNYISIVGLIKSESICNIILGYLVFNYFGHIAAYYVTTKMRRQKLILKELFNPFVWTTTVPKYKGQPNPAVVGIIERALYTSSILVGKAEFIAVWISLKFAGRWKIAKIPQLERTYNPFFAGSGISILFGFIGALMIRRII